MKLSIADSALPNIPWQSRPVGNADLIWRYDANPSIGRRPLPRVTGIYHSVVVPGQGGFAGAFRAEGMDRVPRLHAGRNPDDFKCTFESEPIGLNFIKANPL